MPVPRQRAADVPGQLEFVFDHEETHGSNILATTASESNADAAPIRHWRRGNRNNPVTQTRFRHRPN
jgi:hypothetical protein